MARVLFDLGVWSSADVTFAEELYRLRSGVAHKNRVVIAREVLAGREIRPLEVTDTLESMDITDHVVKGTRLLAKVIAFEFIIDFRKRKRRGKEALEGARMLEKYLHLPRDVWSVRSKARKKLPRK